MLNPAPKLFPFSRGEPKPLVRDLSPPHEGVKETDLGFPVTSLENGSSVPDAAWVPSYFCLAEKLLQPLFLHHFKRFPDLTLLLSFSSSQKVK